MSIFLREVNRENFYECVGLKVAEHQKEFVAPNTFSLAQSKYEPGCMPFCIYDDEIMIGFVMYSIDKDEKDENSSETFWICRFMIDERYQGRGYGKVSMAKVIDYAKNNFSFDEIYLSEVPENKVAKGLYKSFGFEFTGEVIDGEEVMVLKLGKG